VRIRGYAALGLVGIAFPLFDLFQRIAVAGAARLRPSRRTAILAWWINRMRAFVVWCLERVGGATIPMPERVVASGPGTLVIMNHQSVIDIPLMVGAVRGGYPRIVTRARYGRFIPLISHMVRLYQYPVVDPRAKARHVRKSLSSMAQAAETSDVPIGIFPEGTRTKDGDIGRFKVRGLRTLLEARPFTVHLFVSDGYWQRAKLKHFVRGMADVRGRTHYLGSAEWTDPTADPEPFIDELRERMIEGLVELRAEFGSAAAVDEPSTS
jgi:1-acyl-sn-glycerol-3-phosphate acyltransferase